MYLTIEDVTFSYDGGPRLLDDVSVTVRTGEVVAVMGPSGSGKSTLLSLLGGILRPDHGEITWGGQAPDYRRADLLTWVLQNMHVLGPRSALDNVMLGMFACGLTWPETRDPSVDILQRVGLGHCIDRKANDLSGGELQRMTIARALVGAPSLVLADEPTGQLDANSSKLAIKCLVEARAPSTTVIIATHDALVASASDRVFALELGELRET